MVFINEERIRRVIFFNDCIVLSLEDEEHFATLRYVLFESPLVAGLDFPVQVDWFCYWIEQG